MIFTLLTLSALSTSDKFYHVRLLSGENVVETSERVEMVQTVRSLDWDFAFKLVQDGSEISFPTFASSCDTAFLHRAFCTSCFFGPSDFFNLLHCLLSPRFTLPGLASLMPGTEDTLWVGRRGSLCDVPFNTA